EKEHVIIPALFIDPHGPAYASLGVARRQMSRQAHATELDAFAIRNNAVWFHGFICEVITPIEIIFPATHHKISIELAGDDLRAGSALKFGKSCAMIEVSMAIQQDFDVLHFIAKLLDVCSDLCQHFDLPVSRRIFPAAVTIRNELIRLVPT